MKILCITDKKGRIQYNRMCLLKKYFPWNMDVETISCKGNLRNYNLVYYSHFSLHDRVPCPRGITKICSVTSHKCLLDKKATVRKLLKFDGVSVNNTMLYKAFERNIPKLFYTPNGVDTKFFSFTDRDRSDIPVVGWVGNRDRATKNFDRIVKKLRGNFKLRLVASSKKDSIKNIKNAKEMRKFYQNLDFFVVTSSTEGTPNPTLVAMSCGVPVITTRVGNMVEIIEDGVNGYFVRDNIKSVLNGISTACKMPLNKYADMRKAVRRKIEKDWDWNVKKNQWQSFFKRFV